MEKDHKKTAPNVSGSFQVSSEKQQEGLKDLKEEKKLDEESLYYARLFMED
ncbi:hypothetical protein J2S74_002089 [Evansella vedderi]|uniref:Uncharacterized protein n=1 Tax=Evansella vedderi TaxID=38282 RepID=A0ABT9ZX48_9BACI|nr:hypothetical protein [Evansella vedderi]MDQ0254710.1 hypothetical protein [Evansella vedderi]